MHLIGEQGVGLILFIVLALQGGAMLICTGRFLQLKPEGQNIVIAENYLNTAILILFIPIIAFTLIMGWYQVVDLTHLTIDVSWLIYGLEVIGISLIICGTAMVIFGFLALRRTFQPGGFVPRAQDPLVTWGIFSIVRNPLNAGVLFVTLGLALLVQSLFVFTLFVIYLIVVLRVISLEEKQLAKAFGEKYRSYSQKVKRLVPFMLGF